MSRRALSPFPPCPFPPSPPVCATTPTGRGLQETALTMAFAVTTPMGRPASRVVIALKPTAMHPCPWHATEGGTVSVSFPREGLRSWRIPFRGPWDKYLLVRRSLGEADGWGNQNAFSVGVVRGFGSRVVCVFVRCAHLVSFVSRYINEYHARLHPVDFSLVIISGFNIQLLVRCNCAAPRTRWWKGKKEPLVVVYPTTTDGDRTRNPHLRKVMRYHCATMA